MMFTFLRKFKSNIVDSVASTEDSSFGAFLPLHHPLSREMKMSLALVLFSIAMLSISLWFISERNLNALALNQRKTDALYEEIGDIRDENLALNKRIRQIDAEFVSVKASLDSMYDESLSGKQNVSVKSGSIDKQLSSFSPKSFLSSDDNVVLKYPDDMVTFVLVGTHGSLTDTIMVGALNPAKDTVTLISVPRDLYVAGRRINEVYHQFGIEKLKQSLKEILGFKIDYYAIVDMEAFTDVIDTLGGITVNVEKPINDYSYPNEKLGYEPFSITAGSHHMDGDMALKYARSRKSTSDFDRAKRQQQIITALQNRLMELNVLGKSKTMIDLYNKVTDHIHTDVSVFNAVDLLKKYNTALIERGNVLDTTNYLYSMINVSGAYILLPISDSYDDIQAYIYKLIVE